MTTWRIYPRDTNRTTTTKHLEDLGIKLRGFDHPRGAYVGCEFPKRHPVIRLGPDYRVERENKKSPERRSAG